MTCAPRRSFPFPLARLSMASLPMASLPTIWLSTVWLSTVCGFLAALCLAPASARAQLSPEIGYVLPAGGTPGTSIDVVLGGYDWSPDMQIFAHDPRVKIEIIGPPSPVLVPEPPYWFGAKARGPAWPLPREFPARITIPADVPPGLVRWQAANANGVSPIGTFHISDETPVVETPRRSGPQLLPSLPVIVSGQIRRIEEIDEYAFQVPRDGPVTVSLVARQIGSPLHGLLRIHDSEGRKLVDVADTLGRDLTVTFAARAGLTYVVSLHDLDFAGDRSYVYRLSLTQAPRVVAALPAQAKRGSTHTVEFWGWGIATGAARLERIHREVTFPASPPPAATTPTAATTPLADGGAAMDSFTYRLDTPAGQAIPWRFQLAEESDQVEPDRSRGLAMATIPFAVTGALETPFESDDYTVTLNKGTTYRIAAQAGSLGSPLDLELTLFGPDGKQLATQDDGPGTTDPVLQFQPPADGEYRISLADRSGQRAGRESFYRLTAAPQKADFSATIPDRLAVPIGGKSKLTVPVTRLGSFQEPIELQLVGLPEGISFPTPLVIAADKKELAVELEGATDAAASASLVEIMAKTQLDGVPHTRSLGRLVIATTLQPRIKITPEGLDDVRKVSRGSTFLAPLLIERLAGYQGPVTLEMTSKQQRHRQGLASDEFVVPPEATRVEYPIFVPEWMETTKTSRMILNGTVRVADPRGNMRTLVQRMELRIGVLPVGALLKLTHSLREARVASGQSLEIPVQVARSSDFHEAVTIEIRPEDGETDPLVATPLMLAPDESTATFKVVVPAEGALRGRRVWVLRAAALADGRWPVVSETRLEVDVE